MLPCQIMDLRYSTGSQEHDLEVIDEIMRVDVSCDDL